MSLKSAQTHTHTPTHTHIYIYIYVRVCVCVCVCQGGKLYIYLANSIRYVSLSPSFTILTAKIVLISGKARSCTTPALVKEYV